MPAKSPRTPDVTEDVDATMDVATAGVGDSTSDADSDGTDEVASTPTATETADSDAPSLGAGDEVSLEQPADPATTDAPSSTSAPEAATELVRGFAIYDGGTESLPVPSVASNVVVVDRMTNEPIPEEEYEVQDDQIVRAGGVWPRGEHRILVEADFPA